MASTIVFVFVLALGASVSLPISRDGETVPSTKSFSESDVAERTHVLDIETVHSLDEEIQPLPISNMGTGLGAFVNEENHVKRIKRYITKTGEFCPGDLIEYANRCWTQKEYDIIMADEES